MNRKLLWITLLLVTALLITGCNSEARVGELQTESKSVELGDVESVRVEIDFGAGGLELTGGAESLLEADFNYNVAALKPDVGYKNGKLVIRQPGTSGLPVLRDIADFQNEWGLRLSDQVPLDLKVVVGGGYSDLQLAGLPLSRLDVHLGAGDSTIDLSGEWEHDLDVVIDSGAAHINVLLPSEVGVLVEVDPGASIIETTSLMKDGNVYTNAAYGRSEVTMQITLNTGIGWVNLDVDETLAVEAE